MASNFECIGFRFAGAEELNKTLAALLLKTALDLRSQLTQHLRWTDASGASVALHVEDNAVVCATPWFTPAEPARWRVRTEGPTDDEECDHCGGADCDLLDGAGEMSTRATVQFLHYQPYRQWLRKPREFALEMVAFAHRAAVYETDGDFHNAQGSWWSGAGSVKEDGRVRVGFASNCFFPRGMFQPSGRVTARAQVLLAGRVVMQRRLTNAETGAPFWHLQVDSLPGRTDVVAAQVEGAPERGGIAVVEAWLVGRPSVPPPEVTENERRSWLRRLFTP